MTAEVLPNKSIFNVRNVSIRGEGERQLFCELSFSMASERATLVGRNGVGKSTLLQVLAGVKDVSGGTVERCDSLLLVRESLAGKDVILAKSYLQSVDVDRLKTELEWIGLSEDVLGPFKTKNSKGEARKICLLAAKLQNPECLLLDEPSRDLDAQGLSWLKDCVSSYTGALVIASHRRVILEQFTNFLICSEQGCHLHVGTFASLRERLKEDQKVSERRYFRECANLDKAEAHNAKVNARRRRKKNVGRVRELDRMTPKSRLNWKRGYAQESQGRVAKIRAERIEDIRSLGRSARRALSVQLPLNILIRKPDSSWNTIIDARDVRYAYGEKSLFGELSVSLNQHRVGLVGPNGSGKSTLLRLLVGELKTQNGMLRQDGQRLAYLDQGARAYATENSLFELMQNRIISTDEIFEALVAHRFPVSLAQRPLMHLSAGERSRAALICLLSGAKVPELLLLDEPTAGLDVLGIASLESALRHWRGGLVVSSHDLEFLKAVGIESCLSLDGVGRAVWRAVGE